MLETSLRSVTLATIKKRGSRAVSRGMASATPGTPSSTVAAGAGAGALRKSQFAQQLADGPSFGDFVGGEEIAAGTRVSLGNMKT